MTSLAHMSGVIYIYKTEAGQDGPSFLSSFSSSSFSWHHFKTARKQLQRLRRRRAGNASARRRLSRPSCPSSSQFRLCSTRGKDAGEHLNPFKSFIGQKETERVEREREKRSKRRRKDQNDDDDDPLLEALGCCNLFRPAGPLGPGECCWPAGTTGEGPGRDSATAEASHGQSQTGEALPEEERPPGGNDPARGRGKRLRRYDLSLSLSPSPSLYLV